MLQKVLGVLHIKMHGTEALLFRSSPSHTYQSYTVDALL